MSGRITNGQAALLLTALVVAISLHKFWLDAYNNYRIFAGSFDVLAAHQNLYAPHPERYADLFKYSPTFALAMAPFAWQPEVTGLVCWNLLNALALFAALRALWPQGWQARLALAIVVLELVISMQSSQSNALVAALMVAAFAALERRRPWTAGAFIAGGLFLKVYGAAVGCLAILYRWRGRAIGATAVWLVFFALAPLVVLTVPELEQQYRAWLGVRGTFVTERNASIMRIVAAFGSPYLGPVVVQALGAAVFVLPFARVKEWSSPRFRLDLLCSLLIAIVIFNISAEPPTYVVAVTGGAIWYAARPRKGVIDRVVLGVLLLTSFVSTDAYGQRGMLVGPYTLKALGCFIVWVRINAALLTGDYAARELEGAETAEG